MPQMSMPGLPGNRTSQRKVTIAVDIGRYHFIDHMGWHHDWTTQTPREWWQKQQWLKDGGWSQDENINDNHNSKGGGEWHTSV